MYLGIDLGTSAVKAIAIDETGAVLGESSAPLRVATPRPRWSEQDPADWWAGVESAVEDLRHSMSGAFSRLRAVGLSGQMHGATLLDKDDRPLRPAILWNDNRSAAECDALEAAAPVRRLTGNRAMPGFTAPKLLWVRRHEAAVFEATRRVLLPKDYVRLRLTGEYATDLSDASGTLWLDVANRCWSEEMIEASGLSIDAMPALYEGTQMTGMLRAEVCRAWGCESVPVVGGGGDQAAGAVGIGVVQPGRALLSLGTSGVVFAAGDRFQPDPESGVHAFCHALPHQWHQMSVILSAASCLSWITRATGAADEGALLAEVEAAGPASERLLFLPYLSGERTPHNDPFATGVFIGLEHSTDRAALGAAVLDGVAYAFADAARVLLDAGGKIDEMTVVGGGARSRYWGKILASALERPLIFRQSGEVGPALGAARLALVGDTGMSPDEACPAPPEVHRAEPDPGLVERSRRAQPRFKALYATLRETFQSDAERLEGEKP